MNKVIITGRMTKDPELKELPSGSAATEFSLAVDRRSKGNQETDFFNFKAWGKSAELVTTYVHKGDKLGVIGKLQNRKYTTKQGVERTVTEIVVDEIEFLQAKTGNPSPVASQLVEENEPDDFPF